MTLVRRILTARPRGLERGEFNLKSEGRVGFEFETAVRAYTLSVKGHVSPQTRVTCSRGARRHSVSATAY